MQTDEKSTPGAQKEIDKIIQSGKDNAANGTPAHEAAEADIQQDPDLQDGNDNGDELDEGELARLDGEK